MSSGSSPTVVRRRLAAELRELRRRSNLNRKQVADAVGIAESTVTKIENNSTAPAFGVVSVMLDLYGVEVEQRQFLLTLAREARKRGWWQGYKGKGAIPEWFEVYVGMESAASRLNHYDSELIPGLLQTADYYGAYLGTAPVAGAEDIERKIEFRLARQDRLTTSDELELWSIMNEACIRRMVGGRATMKAQLRHLMEISARPNVTLQVLPFEAGSHAAMDGSFIAIEFPDPWPPVIYLESQSDARYLEDPAVVQGYTVVFNHLRAKSLSVEDSLAFIAQVGRDL